MQELPSPYDKCVDLIHQVLAATLDGTLETTADLFQYLADHVNPEQSDSFGHCLRDFLSVTHKKLTCEVCPERQERAQKILKALKIIETEWERCCGQQQVLDAIASTLQQLAAAESRDRLWVLARALDPNRTQPLLPDHLRQLAIAIQQQSSFYTDATVRAEMQELAAGILRGLEIWAPLAENLVRWIDPEATAATALTEGATCPDPWTIWSWYTHDSPTKQLFQAIAAGQPIVNFVMQQPNLGRLQWVEWAVVLHCLQQGTIQWAEQQVQHAPLSRKLASSLFVMFVILWAQFLMAFQFSTEMAATTRQALAHGSFQFSLQILREFAQRSYFNFYNLALAAFPAERLPAVLAYIEEPLRQSEWADERARILTMIGATTRSRGYFAQAQELLEAARPLAETAGDRRCEIANLNHLSRTHISLKDYGPAIHAAQRALVLSREVGDRPGECNALVNLGYSEVMQHQAEHPMPQPAQCETAIQHLCAGLDMATETGDRHSVTIAHNGLGLAYRATNQLPAATAHFQAGVQAAQASGDRYLQGLDLFYLAEMHHRQDDLPQTLWAASLGMYHLEELAVPEWHKPANLLTTLQVQLGDRFETAMAAVREALIAEIGIDGVDHLPVLLARYRARQND